MMRLSLLRSILLVFTCISFRVTPVTADTATLSLPISSLPPPSAFQQKPTPFDLDLYIRHPYVHTLTLPSNASQPKLLPIRPHLSDDDRRRNGALFLRASWIATPETDISLLAPDLFFSPPFLRLSSSIASAFSPNVPTSRPSLNVLISLDHTYASIPAHSRPLFWVILPLAALAMCDCFGFGIPLLFRHVVESCWKEWGRGEEMDWEKVD